jgi:hypothetical protein
MSHTPYVPYVRLVAGLSAALLCGSAIARAQAGKPIVVDDARRLSAVVHEFEKRHGVVVTYEDPLYMFSGDVVDVTSQVRRDGKTSPRILVPLAGPFQFDYEPADLQAPGGTASVLEKLLEAYGNTPYPGVFRLARSGDVFHVIPSMERNALGNMEASSPLLDATIAIDGQERNLIEVLHAIGDAVSAETGTKLVAGGPIASNLFIQTRVRGITTKGIARNLVLEALQATGRRISWRMFCGPEPRFCALSFHSVQSVERVEREE